MPRSARIAILVFVFAFTVTLPAQELTLSLDPAKTTIDFTLGATLHSVHGTFALKSGVIHFNPQTGTASGLVVVDATSAKSGNDGRDHKMHKEILESERFPEITFTPTALTGKISTAAPSEVKLDGIFRLHGTDHPTTLTLPVEINGNVLTAKTHMVIPYIAWGLKNPNTFFLHVSDSVEINISAEGQVQLLQPQSAHEH
jgi:polyisoprenoid-binding protein YceI